VATYGLADLGDAGQVLGVSAFVTHGSCQTLGTDAVRVRNSAQVLYEVPVDYDHEGSIRLDE
jgi:hypothetical protein